MGVVTSDIARDGLTSCAVERAVHTVHGLARTLNEVFEHKPASRVESDSPVLARLTDHTATGLALCEKGEDSTMPFHLPADRVEISAGVRCKMNIESVSRSEAVDNRSPQPEDE